jgi:hypothetical protein
LHVHVGEQLQASPQLHPVMGDVSCVSWQPHLQAAPAQDSHWHWFILDGIVISCFLLVGFAGFVPAIGVSHRIRPSRLNAAADFVERIGYSISGRRTVRKPGRPP